jgi:hypothetical protein
MKPAWCCVLCLALFPWKADAQEAPVATWQESALALSPAYVASLYAATALTTGAATERADAAPRFDDPRVTRTRRGRWLVSVGSSVLAATAITYAFVERYDCRPYPTFDKTAPRVTSALLAAGGAAMTTLGAMRLSSVPSAERQRLRSTHLSRFGKALTAISAGLLASFLIGASAVPAIDDSYGCINS